MEQLGLGLRQAGMARGELLRAWWAQWAEPSWAGVCYPLGIHWEMSWDPAGITFTAKFWPVSCCVQR